MIMNLKMEKRKQPRKVKGDRVDKERWGNRSSGGNNKVCTKWLETDLEKNKEKVKKTKTRAIERRTVRRRRERRKQKSGGKRESNYRENEESISINLYMSIQPTTLATCALHSAYQ